MNISNEHVQNSKFLQREKAILAEGKSKERERERETALSSIFINLFPRSRGVTAQQMSLWEWGLHGSHLKGSSQAHLLQGHFGAVLQGGVTVSLHRF